MIQIEYKLENAGWAVGRIGNGEKYIEFDITYLNDSLKELAESAIGIKEKATKSVTFMNEPGEHKFILNKIEENKIGYELRWYSDWLSWNLVSEDDYKLVLKGETTIAKYVNQVRSVLENIMTEIGAEEYKKRWIKHNFPLEEYLKLK